MGTTITLTEEEVAVLRALTAHKASVVHRSSGNYDDTVYATFAMGSPWDPGPPTIGPAVDQFNKAMEILRQKL
jgi:hypothetical protein